MHGLQGGGGGGGGRIEGEITEFSPGPNVSPNVRFPARQQHYHAALLLRASATGSGGSMVPQFPSPDDDLTRG